MMNKLHELLYKACRMRASDLHVVANLPPSLRLYGELHRMQEVITETDVHEMIDSIITAEQRARLLAQGELDFSYELPDVARFRLNIFRQRGSVSMAIRIIPLHIPLLSDLQLPPVLQTLITRPQGLLLITGPTGSGKSTTLAALIDHINRTERKHIITLEDPIEYMHTHRQSVIQQREIGQDTSSFAIGLRAALRQDPDVILVGEMRDLETIRTAITAAETGHLVLATLHTSSAAATVERIIDVFPAEQQNKIRLQLANILVASVSQRLFPRMDGQGRLAATEILINNTAVANLIRTGKMEQLPSIMQTSKEQGMHLLEASVKEYMARGLISYEAAKLFIEGV
ncbi:type IV pilus twitching motility protein PilT [Ectobacillus antri]